MYDGPFDWVKQQIVSCLSIYRGPEKFANRRTRPPKG